MNETARTQFSIGDRVCSTAGDSRPFTILSVGKDNRINGKDGNVNFTGFEPESLKLLKKAGTAAQAAMA